MNASPDHTISLAVWDIPDWVPLEETLAIKIGAQCSKGCNIAGSEVVISDQAGNELACGVLGAAGSEGLAGAAGTADAKSVAGGEGSASSTCSTNLSCATVAFPAPVHVGAHRLTATLRECLRESTEDTPQHPMRSHAFNLLVTNPSSIAITFTAVAQGSLTPLPDTRIIMRPYRGYTDSLGQLTIMIAPGAYLVHATKDRYEDFSYPLEASTDRALTIELEPSVYEEDYRGYLRRISKAPSDTALK